MKTNLQFTNACTHFLIHLRTKFSLLYQILTYLQIAQDHSKVINYAKQYHQLKITQQNILLKFSNIQLSTLADKNVFDRFCLSLFQCFQNFTINIKTNKHSGFQTANLLPKLQSIFQQFQKSTKQINYLNNFLTQVLDCEQHFLVIWFKKIANENKNIDQLIKVYLTEIIKSQPHSRIKYNPAQLFLKAQHQILNFKIKSKTISQDSFNINPIKNTIRRRQSIKPLNIKLCKHCQTLNIMQIININQIFHEKKNSGFLMLQLLSINKLIQKDIDSFIKKQFKTQLKIQQKNQKQKQITSNKSKNRDLHELAIKDKSYFIQKIYGFNRNKELKSNTSMVTARPHFHLFTKMMKFQPYWSNSKKQLRRKSVKDQRLRHTLFPKLA